MAPTNPLTLARGLGRLAYRAGRPLHLAVTDALAEHPDLCVVCIRSGWRAERADMRGDEYDSSAIGGGL